MCVSMEKPVGVYPGRLRRLCGVALEAELGQQVVYIVLGGSGLGPHEL